MIDRTVFINYCMAFLLQFTSNTVPPNQHVTDTINKINQNRQGKNLQLPNDPAPAPQEQASQQPTHLEQAPEQPQQTLVDQSLQKPVLIEQPQPQLNLQNVQQPQQILVQQQPQQIYIQQEQQPNILFGQPIQPEKPEVEDNLVVNQAQYDTAALFEGHNSKDVRLQLVQSAEQQKKLFQGASDQANFGGFGTKLSTVTQRPSQLIQSTKSLVSGQDVLQINGAVDGLVEPTQVDTTTAKSIVTEYSSNIEHSENINLIKSVEINNQPGVTEASLTKEPIVVADLNDKSSTRENFVDRSEEEVHSTTSTSIETESYDGTEPSTILVTPRPVSTDFLAPITAGIQLQNVESSEKITTKVKQNENYFVEVQKSQPYYLGKFEYVQTPTGYEQKTVKHGEFIKNNAMENIELGKTLLAFPEPQASPLVQTKQEQNVLLQQLPDTIIKENFLETDQQASGLQHQVAVQKLNTPIVVEKVVEKKVPYPVLQTQIVEKAVPVRQFIEKPVHIPYPVEKIVEKPIHVPIEVTRYIDRPYPVQIPVPQPYAVDRIVEKIIKQPYPVEVPYQVAVPHYIEKQVPVEKIVERPVPQYIDRPYPVQVPVHIAQPYLLQAYQFAKHQAYPIPPQYKVKLPLTQQIQKFHVAANYNKAVVHKDQQQAQQNVFYQAYAPTHATAGYLPPKQSGRVTDGYLPPADCTDQHNSQSSRNFYYTIKPDDYIGLLPPKAAEADGTHFPEQFRNARSNFNNNLRLEYGFMPPLIPSLEIDEHGNPIEKDEHK